MKRKLLSSLLCLLLLVSLVGTCGATAMYQLTESQMDQLNSNLTQLSNNNQQLLTQLSQSKQDLETSSSQLVTLKAQLITLQSQTSLALQQQQAAQDSLRIANESFDKLEKANKSKIRSLTLQRDLLIVGIIGMAFKK